MQIIGLTGHRQETTCHRRRDVQRKLLDEGVSLATTSGILLRGVKKDRGIQRGQVLAKVRLDHAAHQVRVRQVYCPVSKDEGGRHTPFFSGYRPQFYFRTTDVTGSANLLGDVEMCMPGDTVEMEVTLINPIAMEAELRFAIREGGRTVGAGVVTKILE